MKNNGYIIHSIALQETWLSEPKTHLPSLENKIKGYNFMHEASRLSRHTGVAFYLMSDFSCDILHCPQGVSVMNTVEHRVIKVYTPDKNIVLCNVYRPPRNNYECFNTCNEMELVLDHIESNENTVV